MSKARDLFVENQLGRKASKNRFGGDHVQLLDNAECLSEIMVVFSVRNIKVAISQVERARKFII